MSEDDPRLPETWSATDNVQWRTPLPGMGWASPVVWGNRVFLTNVASEGEVEEVKQGLYFGGNRPDISPDPHRWLVYGIDFQHGRGCLGDGAAAQRPARPRRGTSRTPTPPRRP